MDTIDVKSLNKIDDTPEEVISYSGMLQSRGLDYTADSFYLQVGNILKVQGWILHISVIRAQISELLEGIIPILVSANISFKIPADEKVGYHLLTGDYGKYQLGKIVCVYPEDNATALRIAKILIDFTQRFVGPDILTDYNLGGRVYTRYGSHAPVVLTATDGKDVRFIYDKKKELVQDSYSIPFKYQKEWQWPFNEIASVKNIKPRKILNKIYLPVKTLKKDVKGNVYKALNLKRWTKIEWCVVKQAKHHMFIDKHGRDIQDRLLWQLKLHDILKDMNIVPAILDYFTFKDDTYLVMEFVEGESLHDRFKRLYHGKAWFSRDREERLSMLFYILKVLDLVEKLHNKGVIHRDLTPTNFLFDTKDELKLIDLELSYSQQKEYPTPPFQYGTPGFVSPEQSDGLQPDEYQDIYALGGLVADLLTGIMPNRFSENEVNRIKEQLYFFTRDKTVSNTISRCFSRDKYLRPTLKEIKSVMLGCYNNMPEFNTDLEPEIQTPSSTDKILQIINNAFSTLEFYQSKKEAVDSKNNFYKSEPSNIGLQDGVAGIIYLISQIKLSALPINISDKFIQEQLSLLITTLNNPKENYPTDFLNGSLGMVYGLASAVKSNLIEYTPGIKEIIIYYLKQEVKHINIADGIAGKGITVMHCKKLLSQEEYNLLIKECIDILLSTQKKDGSWITYNITKSNKKETYLGLFSGMSGIIYFLLSIGNETNDPLMLNAAERGLDWMLTKQQIKKDGNTEWPVHCTSEVVNQINIEGNIGIARIMLKGFELFKKNSYKTAVTSILNDLTPYLVKSDLSFLNGVGGIGHLYLEAYNILEDENWYKRTSWLTETILNSSIIKNNQSVYWFIGLEMEPSYSLFTGNPGIIYYLLRSIQYGRISFPITC